MDGVQFVFWAMQGQLRKLFTMRQEPKERLDTYATRFMAQVDVSEDIWGKFIPENKFLLRQMRSME